MDSRTQISLIDEMCEALTRDKRDIVVMQAITNVRDRQPMGGWCEVSPGDGTQAIYDEIRRLHQARANETPALAEGAADNASNQMA
jgi:hypothetical protein